MSAAGTLILAADAIEQTIGKRPSPELLWRWRTRGVRLPDGSQVRLVCKRCGGRWYCDPDAVREFIDAQTSGFSDDEQPAAPDLTDRLRAAGLSD